MQSKAGPKKGRGGRRAGAGRKRRLCPVRAPKGPRGGKRPGAGRKPKVRTIAKLEKIAEPAQLELFRPGGGAAVDS